MCIIKQYIYYTVTNINITYFNLFNANIYFVLFLLIPLTQRPYYHDTQLGKKINSIILLDDKYKSIKTKEYNWEWDGD